MTNIYKQLRIWILFSWSFLTIGILLGSWWAYHELGWGGWWFWDPVENASLMPWLLATAGIHSIIRKRLKLWAFFCIQSTFIFSILGTFFVRSGLLSSVHSFATDSSRGFYLLIFLLFLISISIFHFWVRCEEKTMFLSSNSFLFKFLFLRKRKKTKYHKKEKLFEQLFTLQNFYFCTICGVVFCGTAAPLIFQWFWDRETITGPSFYNGTNIPLFTSVFFIFIYAHYLQFFSPWVYSSTDTNQVHLRKKTTIIYFLIYFFIHLFIGYIIFELNILNSIYIAICFLFISCIILSRYENNMFMSFFIMPFSSFPNRLLAKIPYSINQNFQFIKETDVVSKKKQEKFAERRRLGFFLFSVFDKQSFLTVLFNFFNKIIKRNWSNLNLSNGAVIQKILQPLVVLWRNIFFVAEKTDFFVGYPTKNENRPKFNCRTTHSNSLSVFGSQKQNEMNIAHTGLVFLILGILFSNTYKFEQRSQFNPGPEGAQRLHSQICYLRSIDHSFAPTFHSICANLLISQENPFCLRSLTPFHNKDIYYEERRFAPILCMFPEKRFYYSNQNIVTTKVSIYSNLFTDFYSIIGTGSIETGWFTTIIKLPFIFCIWLGFTFGVIGGILRLTKLLRKPKLVWF